MCPIKCTLHKNIPKDIQINKSFICLSYGIKIQYKFILPDSWHCGTEAES